MTMLPPGSRVPRKGDRLRAQELVDRGIAAENSGAAGQALQCYRQAIEADPGFAPAHMNLGIALQAAHDLVAAIAAYQRAIALDPAYAAAHYNQGMARLILGEYARAQDDFREALRLRSEFPEAWVGLADALEALGRDNDALAALNNAIGQREHYAGALLNAGALLKKLGRVSEAEAGVRRLLERVPDYPEAHNNLGIVLQSLGRVSEAIASYRRALEFKPDYHEAHSNLIFALDLLEDVGIEQQQQERRRWYERHGQKHAESIKPHGNVRDSERKLRLGYVSADFCSHSASYIFSPVIRRHDRSAFEVFCYSGVRLEDEVTARLRQAAREWRSTLGVSDDALAEQIRSDGIDILVDLSAHTAGNRLPVFARKPAPVQVTAWGHANGTGLETMDYLLADAVSAPDHERSLYAEKVINLPCIVCYEPPEYIAEVSALPADGGKAFTFGCINRIEKISDRAMALWGRILAALPEARLLIKGSGLDDPEHRRHFVRRLVKAGLAEERVRLIGVSAHVEHLKAYHEVDLGLDPFPHGGGISTAEALWMGVPVVAMSGSTIPGRVTASILTSLQMPEWIARRDEEYVRIAVQAARELPALARLRVELRSRLAASALGDVQRYTRELEAAFRLMWRRWCAGNTPVAD